MRPVVPIGATVNLDQFFTVRERPENKVTLVDVLPRQGTAQAGACNLTDNGTFQLEDFELIANPVGWHKAYCWDQFWDTIAGQATRGGISRLEDISSDLAGELALAKFEEGNAVDFNDILMFGESTNTDISAYLQTANGFFSATQVSGVTLNNTNLTGAPYNVTDAASTGTLVQDQGLRICEMLMDDAPVQLQAMAGSGAYFIVSHSVYRNLLKTAQGYRTGINNLQIMQEEMFGSGRPILHFDGCPIVSAPRIDYVLSQESSLAYSHFAALGVQENYQILIDSRERSTWEKQYFDETDDQYHLKALVTFGAKHFTDNLLRVYKSTNS